VGGKEGGMGEELSYAPSVLLALPTVLSVSGADVRCNTHLAFYLFLFDGLSYEAYIVLSYTQIGRESLE
jgi:hypothetical protein